MDILSPIISIITGIGGSLTTAFVKYKMAKLDIERQKLKQDYELKRIEAETNAMIKEAEANIRVTETVTEGKVQIAEVEAYKESLKEGYLVKQGYIERMLDSKSKFLQFLGSILVLFMGIVDVCKAAIRPGTTIYILILATWLSYQAWNILSLTKQPITPELASKIVYLVIYSIFQLLFVIIGWWFTDRRIAKDFFKKFNL